MKASTPVAYVGMGWAAIPSSTLSKFWVRLQSATDPTAPLVHPMEAARVDVVAQHAPLSEDPVIAFRSTSSL